MREITKSVFVAEDGIEFTDKNECLHHERLKQVRDIIDNHTVYGNVVLSADELAEDLLKWHFDECKKGCYGH